MCQHALKVSLLRLCPTVSYYIPMLSTLVEQHLGFLPSMGLYPARPLCYPPNSVSARPCAFRDAESSIRHDCRYSHIARPIIVLM